MKVYKLWLLNYETKSVEVFYSNNYTIAMLSPSMYTPPLSLHSSCEYSIVESSAGSRHISHTWAPSPLPTQHRQRKTSYFLMLNWSWRIGKSRRWQGQVSKVDGPTQWSYAFYIQPWNQTPVNALEDFHLTTIEKGTLNQFKDQGNDDSIVSEGQTVNQAYYKLSENELEDRCLLTINQHTKLSVCHVVPH